MGTPIPQRTKEIAAATGTSEVITRQLTNEERERLDKLGKPEVKNQFGERQKRPAIVPGSPINGSDKRLLGPQETAPAAKSEMLILQFPLIVTTTDRVTQQLKLHEEYEEVGAEIESGNRVRTMLETFDLIQALMSVLRAELTDLHPGEDVTPYVKRFFEYGVRQHHEKITAYANERGWSPGGA